MVEIEVKKPEVEKEEVNEEVKKEDESTPIIEEAKKAAELMKIENDRKEAALTREENLQAKKILGGTAEAGIAPEKPKGMTEVEYADAYMKGEVDPFKEDGVE